MNSSCDVDVLFPNAAAKIKGYPMYSMVNRGGPKGLDTRSECWAIADDPLKVQGCVMGLVKFLDGSPVAVRYLLADVFVHVLVPFKEYIPFKEFYTCH